MSEKIKYIIDLTMRINEETEFAAFAQINGHVNNLSIYIGKDKEWRFNEWLYEADFYYSGKLKSEYTKINGIVSDLKEFLEVQ